MMGAAVGTDAVGIAEAVGTAVGIAGADTVPEAPSDVFVGGSKIPDKGTAFLTLIVDISRTDDRIGRYVAGSADSFLANISSRLSIISIRSVIDKS